MWKISERRRVIISLRIKIYFSDTLFLSFFVSYIGIFSTLSFFYCLFSCFNNNECKLYFLNELVDSDSQHFCFEFVLQLTTLFSYFIVKSTTFRLHESKVEFLCDKLNNVRKRRFIIVLPPIVSIRKPVSPL